MAYRLNFSDYDPPAAPPPPPVAPPTGGSIPGGPAFIGFPQPPDVPCDPTGDGWRGPPGPPGPPMGSFVSDTAPLNPVSGQLWFDSSNPQLYVWFVDPTSAQWVIATAYAGGLTTDAPSDGQVYGRQNGAWQNFAAGGPYLPLTGGTVTGNLTIMTTDWLSPLSGWHRAISNTYVLTPTGIGGTALTGGALSTAGVNGLAIGITGLGFNQSAGSVNGAWGGYFEARQYPGATSYTQGIEVDVCNVSATDAVQGSPYINFPQPTSIGINLQSGGQVHSESPPLVAKAASVGIWVGDNDARFQTGIIFKNTALVGTDGTGTGTAQAVTMATGHQIQWYMPSGALGPSIGSQQTTGTPGQIVFENSRVHIVGGLFAPGGVTVGPPTILGGTSYTVSATDYTLIIAGSGTFTLTLPTSVGNVGRVLILKNAVAFAVNSASGNVFPFTGGAAGTAIMPVGPSKFCWLQCDGTNWQMMMAN